MLWPFAFLRRFHPKRTRGTRTKPGGPRRAVYSRPAVEELEPRILLAHHRELLPHPHQVAAPVHVAARLSLRAHQGGALGTPGTPGQTLRVTFTWTASDAAFPNELGLFAVDDASGRLGNLTPGQRGYVAAALARSRRQVVFASGRGVGATRVLQLPTGRCFGLYL